MRASLPDHDTSSRSKLSEKLFGRHCPTLRQDVSIALDRWELAAVMWRCIAYAGDMSGADPDQLSPRVRHARRLFAPLGRRYDLMSEVMSFGENRRWRRFLVSRVPPGGRVLDVATGTAGVAIALARRSDRVVGLDQSEPMLLEGRERVRRAGLEDRITLLLGQAERLPFPDTAFDAVTFAYLVRYVDDLAATLAGMARVVRPGGVMACLEFGVPANPVSRAGWYVHTRVGLPAVGALASRDWFRSGRFLGPNISDFYRRHPLPEQLDMWRAASVRDVRARTMTLGAGVVTWGTVDGG